MSEEQRKRPNGLESNRKTPPVRADAGGRRAARERGANDGRGGTARREAIVELVRARGFASIDDLSRRFRVTPQTIRRDINALSAEGTLARYHGGTGLPTGSTRNIAYADRRVAQFEAMVAIARAVAARVPDHASLIINIGTTTEAVARALAGHRGLRVVTNNLNVAVTLAAQSDFEVSIAGGVVRNADGGVVGGSAADYIGQFRVDIAIMGISGIGPDGALLDFDPREVRVAQAILDSARTVFLCADHTKFGRNAMVRVADVDRVDALFTDRPPPPPIARRLAEAGVAVHVAPTGEPGTDEPAPDAPGA